MEGRYIRRRMAPTFRDLLAATKKSIKEITVDEVKKLLDAKAPVKLIDVRETEEYGAGRLPGAVSVPRGFLELKIEEKAKRDEDLILYCAGGVRSALAAQGP
jgi:rhodanese-related sulfurtransferase